MWSWTGEDDNRVTGFTAQISRNGRPWQTLVRPSRSISAGGKQRVALTVPSGKHFAIRVRAHDASGFVSLWTERKQMIRYRNIRRADTHMTGSWKIAPANGSAFQHDVIVTRQDGATASLSTTARSISIIGRRGPRAGFLEIEDGESTRLISLYAVKRKDLAALHTWTWPGVAPRTVTITSHTKKPRRAVVALDAWVVTR
jgi:hypothetical protein